MLLMLPLSSSSRIFALRSFSSGLRLFLVICFSSCLMSLFYTILNLKAFNYPLTTSNAFDHICRQQTYGFA